MFSSGVTIALKSANLAADLLDRQFRGETVDWQTQFAEPLMYGVETFRSFVNGWYDGDLQDVIFFAHKDAGDSPHDLLRARRLCLGSEESVHRPAVGAAFARAREHGARG